MKRFYKSASVGGSEGAFQILLDGRALKTPSGGKFSLPRRALAEAVAQEWHDTGENIDMHNMPITRLAFAAIDGIGKNRAQVEEQILAFARADLLAYRAEAPRELIARQAAVWDPFLDWAAQRHGARLSVGSGIIHVPQPSETLKVFEQAVRGMDDFTLAALHAATTLTGSLVLALALIEGRTDSGEIFAAATLDEAFQAEKWGWDAEAEARLKQHGAELAAAARFLALLA